MTRLLLGGTIGALIVVGVGYCLSLAVMHTLSELGTLVLPVEPWRLPAHVRESGWGEYETFYATGVILGSALGLLWVRRPAGDPERPLTVRAAQAFGLRSASILAVAAIALVLTPVRAGVIGWCRGENFYRGCPTSYWVGELRSVCTAVDLETEVADEVALSRGRNGNNLMTVIAEDVRGDAVPELIDMLHDPNPVTRIVAILTLHRIGRDSVDATPALIEVALHDEEPALRLKAALAVVRIGPGREQAVPVLVAALTDTKLPWRGAGDRACAALGRIGPDARDAIPTLIALTEHDHSRWCACEALKKIDPGVAEPVGKR